MFVSVPVGGRSGRFSHAHEARPQSQSRATGSRSAKRNLNRRKLRSSSVCVQRSFRAPVCSECVKQNSSNLVYSRACVETVESETLLEKKISRVPKNFPRMRDYMTSNVRSLHLFFRFLLYFFSGRNPDGESKSR